MTKTECVSRLSGKASREALIEPENISELFGIPDMWDIALEEIAQEKSACDSVNKHPELLDGLKQPVSLDETFNLLEHTRQELFGAGSLPPTTVYLTDNPDKLHLFWLPTHGTIDYTTPSTYALADQLSFDIPHNVTHISHLAFLSERGNDAYWDAMPQRGYFEALAVLSERQMLEKLKEDDTCSKEVAKALSPHRNIAPTALRKWMIEDRIFEARLRNARLAADHFTVQGAEFSEMTHEVAKLLELDIDQAEAEARKYYRLTGLGANYTLGYRKLWQQGIRNPIEGMTGKKGQPITTWNEFGK